MVYEQTDNQEEFPESRGGNRGSCTAGRTHPVDDPGPARTSERSPYAGRPAGPPCRQGADTCRRMSWTAPILPGLAA